MQQNKGLCCQQIGASQGTASHTAADRELKQGWGAASWGAPCTPLAFPNPKARGSSARGAPPGAQPQLLLCRQPLERSASWLELQPARTRTPKQPPSARGVKAAPSTPSSPPPTPSSSARACGQLQPSHAAVRARERLREGDRLGCSSLPYIPPKYSPPGAADAPAPTSWAHGCPQLPRFTPGC